MHLCTDGSVCFVHLFFLFSFARFHFHEMKHPCFFCFFFMWRQKNHTISSLPKISNLMHSRSRPTSAARPLHHRPSDQPVGFLCAFFFFSSKVLQEQEWTREGGRTCVSSRPSRNNTTRSVQLVQLQSFLLAVADCLQRHESQAFNPGHISRQLPTF